MRTVDYNELAEHTFYGGVEADEKFEAETIVRQALTVITNNLGTATAIVSAEWERKTEIVRGALNDPSPYRDGSDELIVTLEVRLPSYLRSEGDVAALVGSVEDTLIERSDAAYHAELERLEAEQAAAEARVQKLRQQREAAVATRSTSQR